jgi:ferritin-like protein
MKKIFAYTKAAGLPKRVIRDIADAGYVPVPVENFDCVRLIEPIAEAENSALIKTAFRAIQQSKGYDNVREQFAKMLLDELLKSAEKSK